MTVSISIDGGRKKLAHAAVLFVGSDFVYMSDSESVVFSGRRRKEK